MAVAYIMSVTNLGWKESLKVVRVGRAVANPNFGFQRQLEDFETFKLSEVKSEILLVFLELVFNKDYTRCQLFGEFLIKK